MTKEQAIERLTDLYQLIYYAERLDCKSAGIGADYYDETKDALEVAIRVLRGEENGCSDKSDADAESV